MLVVGILEKRYPYPFVLVRYVYENGVWEMIVAKWKSIVRHFTNKHENHPDELFPRCDVDELDDCLWIQVGMC